MPLPNLSSCKKLGFIVPSSNTALEPLTTAILSSISPAISVHFSRVRVQTLGTDTASTSQFSTANMIAAAQLLADAGVDAILWNGTSGMWIGADLSADEQLAAEMSAATGVPCSTTTLAMVEALKFTGVQRISLAVPYTDALTAKLVTFYSGCGFEVVKTARMQAVPESNREIARTRVEAIWNVIRKADDEESEAVVVACTNWPAAPLVEGTERELGKWIFDSVVVTAWWALRMVEVEDAVEGWGRLFRLKRSDEA